jgi:hypothetical protein
MDITDRAPMVEPLDEQVDHVRGEASASVAVLYQGGYDPGAFIEALAR